MSDVSPASGGFPVPIEGGDRLAILTFRHLDGILLADEATELNDLLRASPRVRGQFTEVVQRESLLVEMSPSLTDRRLGKWSFGSKCWIFAIILIGVLAAVAIAWLIMFSLPRSITRLASIEGVVRVWRHGITVPPVAGLALYAGDRIEIISGTCHIGFTNEDTRLELGDEASLLIEQVDGEQVDGEQVGGKQVDGKQGDCRKRVRLDHGWLNAEIDDQPPGTGLHIESPQAVARAFGTSFSFTVTHGTTALHVRHGVVTFATVGQREGIHTTAGRTLTTDGICEPRDATPSVEASPVPIEIPRRWQINAASAAAVHGRGWKGKPVGDHVLGVIDEQTTFQMVSPPASESGFVAAGPGLLIHVHVQVAKPCMVGVLLTVHDASGAWLGNLQAERLINANQPQELVLAWDDLRVVSGVAQERLAKGVIGQMMVMCWETDARLQFFMASLEK